MGLLDKLNDLEETKGTDTEVSTQPECPQESKATDDHKKAASDKKIVKTPTHSKANSGLKSKTGSQKVGGTNKANKTGSSKTSKGTNSKFQGMANTARAAKTGKASANVRQSMKAMDKLNEVGEDGLTHKERMEQQVKEEAAKIKKIIYAICGVMLVIIIIFVATKCGSSPRSSQIIRSQNSDIIIYPSDPASLKEAGRTFNSQATSFCKNNFKKKGKAFCREGVMKMVKEHLVKYPKNKDLTDTYVKRLEEDGWI